MPEISEATLQALIARARKNSKNAYVIYSNFPVGAAVLSESGEIFDGCNIENASYGLTICAERNAVFQMVARGEKRLAAVVVYTPTPTPSPPCGCCRQVINEFGPEALVVSTCDGPQVLRTNLTELLPLAFGPSNLK
jgi:cytidine deaminase